MADIDEVESDEEDSQETTAATTTTEKKERKIYKGEVMSAAAVAALVEKHGATPIQPVKRKFKLHNFDHALPPSFVATRFTPSFGGGLTMHFYQPSTGTKIYREVPKDLELNVLSGRRSEELREDWQKALDTKLGHLARRLSCTIGTDPEVFVVDKKGVVIPAWEYLPEKKKPVNFKSPDINGSPGFVGTAYWDGFQAEFTTQAGLSCLAQMGDVLYTGLKTILSYARKHDKGARLSLASVLQAPDTVLSSADPDKVAFGCAPSRNIYGLKGNDRDGREVPYRFAGGHIHVGVPGYSVDKIEKMIRSMDNILGVAAVSMFAKYDNPIRRQFYGQPGEHRLPSHGFEYRTLSNAWLAHPLIYHMTFDLARAAAGLVEEGMDNLWQATEKETVETIMNHDVEHARKILDRNKKLFLGLLQTCGGRYLMDSDAPELGYKVWSSGMETAIADPEDIEGNWRLTETGTAAWVVHSGGPGAQFYQAYPELKAGKKL
jgi:hypothetical protein